MDKWRGRLTWLRGFFVLSLMVMAVRFFYVQVPSRQRLLASVFFKDIIQQELSQEPAQRNVQEAGASVSWSSISSSLAEGLQNLILELTPHKAEADVRSFQVLLEETTVSRNRSYPPKLVTMPNLLGGSMRKALSELAELGLKVQVEGSGTIVGQYPPPGERVAEDTLCRLVFAPAPQT